MAESLQLWNLLETGKYNIVLSQVNFDELERCAEPKLSILTDFLQRIEYTRVESDSSTVALASQFIDFGVLKEKSFDDCRHIAAALLAACDIIVSWNFHHVVNPDTMIGTGVIAATGGYKDIVICSPTSLINGGSEDE